MTIAILRLLLDFGLVVLIWMVQCIVYPSFIYFSTKNLVRWHKEYTSSISFIVMPLMFGQLGISIYQVMLYPNIYTVSSLTLVSLIWVATFLQFVPIHANISNGIVNQSMLQALVKKNRIRTFLWTLLFAMSCATVF